MQNSGFFSLIPIYFWPQSRHDRVRINLENTKPVRQSYFVVCSVFLILAIIIQPTQAEIITVKYRPVAVDTEKGSFKEFSLGESSFINRILYDQEQKYLLVKLRDTFYHYCSIPKGVVTNWTTTRSLGRFYNNNVKGNFDCREHKVPGYH